ncbi:helix-turn-helix domain-containing protein [Actinophytocola sp.]|uniref:helix-turn-helix domain-containing protein n=1 Tax=Actinophytocola sp. TaxID=1872138 RepID=UPI0039C85A9A
MGLALARAAKAKGIAGRELARGLGWSDSKISRIFNANRGATIPDVAALCALCGIKGPKTPSCST